MSATPTVVVTRRIFDEALRRLSALHVIDNQTDQPLDIDAMRLRVAEADVLLSTASDPLERCVLDAAPRLKAICNIAVGYNNVDLDACRERGIFVTNTPDVLTQTTADFAFALLLATARRVTESEAWLRAGQWQRWSMEQMLGVDVHGATLGIIGMGRIGGAIARRASGFDMRVLYHNRSRSQDEQGAQWVEKATLLERSDHVVVVLPYSQATHHFIGARELTAMKQTATLINVARGGVVDDAALAEALHRGRLAGAGLDVFEDEPRVHPRLLECSNVVLTPHIGSASRPTRLAMVHHAIDNLFEILNGQRPRSLVNADVYAISAHSRAT